MTVRATKIYRGLSYFFIGFTAILLFGYALPTLAKAQQVNDPNPKLEIEKSIWNPKSDQWESDVSPNSGSNPYTYSPESKVKFKLTIKNIGDVDLEDIEVWDNLPNKSKYEDGDGSPENNGKKVVFSKFNLSQGSNKVFEFRAKIDDYDDFDEGTTCLANEGKVKAEYQYEVTVNPEPVQPQRYQECEDEVCEEIEPEPEIEIKTIKIDESDSGNFCVRKTEDTEEKTIEDITELPKTGGGSTILLLSFSLVAVGTILKKHQR